MQTHTRILMTASAVFQGLVGIACSFMSQEILTAGGMPASWRGVVLLQVLGALYLGFAILDWMARGVIIGGVYARPVALGNFLHFSIVAVVLVKALATRPGAPELLVSAGLYAVFAVWFGVVVFTHPAPRG